MNHSSLPQQADELLGVAESVATVLSEKHEQLGLDTQPETLLRAAIAARTPVVGLFGPTEWWRNGSPYVEDICIERNDIDCREDCHRRACSKWICMDIEVERVLDAVTERLRRASAVINDHPIQIEPLALRS